jgi:hypothetical protein
MVTLNVDAAVDFVEQSGDATFTALAHFALGRITPDTALATISRHQRADGGWSGTDKDFQADISSLSCTQVALQWLVWLDAHHTPVAHKTVAFLQITQHNDGSWDEPTTIRQFDPPAWMLPGNYANQLWLTAAICCKLKELGQEAAVNFETALTFLRRGWDGTRFPAYHHTHWMVMPLLVLHQSTIAEDLAIINGCKRVLEQGIEENRVDLLDICAIAHASVSAGAVAADLYQAALSKVVRAQQSDGGWPTMHAAHHRASATVDALFLLKRAGLLDPVQPGYQ